MNEKTIIENRPTVNGQSEKKNSGAWKFVTLGGVSGVLMGAGLLFAGQAAAKVLTKEDTPNAEEPEAEAPDPTQTSHTLENGLQVAAVSDDLSFGEAFAQARAEVGPGGVFHWHGGIYGTYSADEWNAMTVEQKHDFAQQVKPEVSADDVSTPTDADTHVVVVHHVYEHEPAPTVEHVQPAVDTSDDVQVVQPQPAAETANDDSDVHIVGYGEIEGHMAVGYDTDGDGEADVAIIDVNDNMELDNQDVVIDNQGNVATVGEIAGADDPNQMANMENPDVASDMPDYMNDAMIDA